MTETTFCGDCVDGRELMWGWEGMEWKLNEMGGHGYGICGDWWRWV